MSAFGTKRTWHFALHMSAFDPKRNLALVVYRVRGGAAQTFNSPGPIFVSRV